MDVAGVARGWRRGLAPLALAGVAACGGAEKTLGPGDGEPVVLPGSWTPVAPLPEAIADGAATAFGGHVWVVGGRRVAQGDASDRAYRYDPSADRWERLPDLPTRAFKPAIAVFEGRLLVIGGNLSTTAPTPQADVWAWDEARRAWTHHSRLPLPSISPFAASSPTGVLATRLGGATSPPGDSTGFLPAGTMAWRYAPPAPVAHTQLISLGGEVWALGTTEMVRFDPVAGAWSGREPLPGTGFLLGAWSRDGRLHLTLRIGNQVDHFLRTGAGAWSGRAAPPGSEKRSGAMTATLGDRLYLIGGDGQDDGLLRRVDAYAEPTTPPGA